jgi:hypothetical protein
MECEAKIVPPDNAVVNAVFTQYALTQKNKLLQFSEFA